MVRKYLLQIFALLSISTAFAQDDTNNNVSPTPLPKINETSIKEGDQTKPTIEIGGGNMFFIGDISSKSYRNPFLSRYAFRIGISTKVNSFLDAGFNATFGRVEGNERTKTRNLNFQSQVRMFGFNVSYDLSHIIKNNRTSVEPFVTLGLNAINFVSKTDLKDQNGFTYYYWDDGSIMNLPQDDPNAASAVALKRDYIFESDIRELNLDGFGRYPEFTLAMPVGAGIKLKIGRYTAIKLGMTYMYSFTDFIDGVTKDSKEIRQGKKGNDQFLFTEAGLSFNLNAKKHKKVDYSKIDFLALETDDTDGDGVKDGDDNCQMTPPGVEVDAKGCPLDTDADGVPDFRDLEKNSPEGSYVNDDGVALTDEELMKLYLSYLDSTNEGKIKREAITSILYGKKKSIYRVQLGSYASGVPPEVMNKLLNVKEMRTEKIGNETVYFVGDYFNLVEAENTKRSMADFGIPDAKVMEYKNGRFIPVSTVQSSDALTQAIKTDQIPEVIKEKAGNSEVKKSTKGYYVTTLEDPNDKIIYRIQVGAFKNPKDPKSFRTRGNVVEVNSNDGMHRYYSGSFTDYNAAAKHKIDVVADGYSGAFIVAFKNGQPIRLQDAGATRADTFEAPPTLSKTDKNNIRYKVQIGIFANQPSAEVQEKLSRLPNVEKTPAGNAFKYTVGSFSSYKEANQLKMSLIKEYGFKDAFMVAFLNGQKISVAEAVKITE